MGLLERAKNLLTTSLSDLLAKAESPERMLAAHILELTQIERQGRRSLLDVIKEEKILQRKLTELKEAEALWQGRAEAALQRERDDLARRALIRKRELAREKATLSQEVDNLRRVKDDLKNTLRSIRERMETARRERARLLGEKTRQRLKRLEEIAARKTGEAVLDELEAWAALEAEDKTDRILELERDEIEAELKELKKRLLPEKR
jgi:phage shock protein A